MKLEREWKTRPPFPLHLNVKFWIYHFQFCSSCIYRIYTYIYIIIYIVIYIYIPLAERVAEYEMKESSQTSFSPLWYWKLSWILYLSLTHSVLSLCRLSLSLSLSLSPFSFFFFFFFFLFAVGVYAITFWKKKDDKLYYNNIIKNGGSEFGRHSVIYMSQIINVEKRDRERGEREAVAFLSLESSLFTSFFSFFPHQ